MKYGDFIKGNEGFQYSINLQYDLMNQKKIEGYIPTRKSTDILYEYLLNTKVDERDKATVLIGPYGKGKSHLLLILLGLMCGNSESKELNKLVDKIKNINPQCGVEANEVLTQKKYLPLIINFNSDDLNQAFLVALNHALKDANIKDILPSTYFDSAISTINGWQVYEDNGMITKVKALIKNKCGLNLQAYLENLNSYDKKAYELFKEVFEEVTSGISFNPMVNSDIVKLIEETNYKLKEIYGYDGIIIVFDEFSKFIEASDNINNKKDLKILQDIAELSARSKSPQMHLVCITHKTINEYISKIPQEKIDDWRTIEGRFKEILFISSSQQNYELISNATKKNETKLKEFIKNNKEILEELTSEGERLFNSIYKNKDYIKEIVHGCFPLHPYTTFALPIVSEKVAQNERTLFTYLSKEESNSLIDFVNRNTGELELVTLDQLYDYFEPLFKKETFNESIYNVWIQIDTALKIAFSDLEKKIIKVLGIIYIVNDLKIISPNEYTLRHSLNEEKEKIEKSLQDLKQRDILILRKGSDTLDFLPTSSVDVKNKIKNLAETRFKDIKHSEVYSELVDLKYILPKKYNDEYKITRYFKRVFMTIDEMTAYSNAEQLLKEYDSDGIIIDLIYFREKEMKETNDWLEIINDNRILVVIPSKGVNSEISKNISEYKSMQYLKNDVEFLKEDKAIETQLELLYEDLTDKIINYVRENYELTSSNCSIYANAKQYKFIKLVELSDLISSICEKNFANTPKINNELINKNNLSGQIEKARDIIVSLLLNGSYRHFDYTMNSSECTLFRATIKNQNLLEDNVYNNIIVDEIFNFINKAESEEVSLGDLYNILTSNVKGIGARKGILPIYLAFAFKDYKDEAILYLRSGRSKKEMNLDYKILTNINDNPDKYLLKIEKGTVEKTNYINELSGMFLQYLNSKSDNKFINIVKGMQSWLQSLSLLTQNYKKDITNDTMISSNVVKLRRDIMRYEMNYREFLFGEIISILKVDSYDKCINKLKAIKKQLDSYDDKVKEYLIKKTNQIINKNYQGSLSSNLRLWYLELEKDKKVHLYNGTTNDLLKLINNIDNNDKENINRLAKIMTGLSIEDWNDTTIDVYLEELTSCKNSIDNYEVACDKANDSLIKIVFNTEDDKQVEKTFNKTAISEMGSMLLNALDESIEEFADSIDDNEKRNILMNILERYI